MTRTTNTIDLTGFTPKPAAPFAITVPGRNTAPNGSVIDFTTYYMTVDGKPFYGVCGEFHYSRMDASRWDEELAKMAMGGVNVVSTYIFWNHHEEHEDEWDFTGNRDLRRFIQLCAKHGLYVIVRMGPFDHGEVRNGGLPDWMYGKPYEVRSLDPAFLDKVRDLYEHEAAQFEGLYFKDGGPIIAAQLDNEYMHSAAPWEMTTGISDEWVPGGHDGMAYLDRLREIATEAGIDVPFYTSTGWGGSPVPGDVLPLWGGYAYRPWLFYSHQGEHPLTDEYIYRNFHADDCPRNEEFEPNYPPSAKPYACCEMGGGMVQSYYYRFILPLKSVDAMANIKLGSGCNMLGYYMFQGGTNPIGDGVYLNEGQVPKRSYDYQAALGESGQVRESYRRLKTLHYFTQTFGSQLTPLEVAVPEGQESIDPADQQTLRWCVRTDGHRGFVFLNNFQDHGTMEPQNNRTITLTLADGTVLTIDGIGLDNEENCILPFNLDLDGVTLVAATVQPVTAICPKGAARRTVVFMKPDGMTRPWMRFAPGTVLTTPDGSPVSDDTAGDSADGPVVPVTGDFDRLTAHCGETAVDILVIDRETANNMFAVNGETLVFTDADSAAYLPEPGVLAVESLDAAASVRTLPETAIDRAVPVAAAQAVDLPAVTVHKVTDTRYILDVPEGALAALGVDGVKDLRLRIRYHGDIGWLWAGSMLVSDNFANDDVWEIGLAEYAEAIRANAGRLVLTITPLKEGAKVNVESAMAARTESADALVASLDAVELIPVYERRYRMN